MAQATVKVEPGSTQAISNGVSHTKSEAEITSTPPVKVKGPAQQEGNASTSGDVVPTTEPRRYTPPKFNPQTEKELRDLMNKARSMQRGESKQFNTEEEILGLALFATNLVQLMNSEYIVSGPLNTRCRV